MANDYLPSSETEKPMLDHRPDPKGARPEEAHSDRKTFWLALAITLVPIPIALLVSIALGSPPWRPRPALAPPLPHTAPASPTPPGSPVPR